LLANIPVKGQVPMVFAAEAGSGVPDRPGSDNLARIIDDRKLPEELVGLMHASQSKYLEGSGWIAAGDPDKAREEFDDAVNLLLQSDWDLASTPALNEFFQDLIQRIAGDESSNYLALRDAQNEAESASVDELKNLDLIPIEVDPALRDEVTADLAETRYEIPITVNERVMKSLNYWLSSGRKGFEAGLIRSGQYRPMIEEIFREESVPLDLIYLAQVESRFKPLAVSKAQAKGIWQFSKSTAIRYGLRITRDLDERCDPEKSTRAAARYLKDLYAMFQDWNLVLAAYNWGEGKVQRLVDRSGLNDFWQLVDLRRRFPTETKNHIPLVQASVIIGRNPGKYGFSTEFASPIQYAKVPVSKPINLRAAAKALGTSLEELRKLNPSLRGMTTPANYSGYRLKVPVDVNPNAQEKLAALPRATIKPPPGYEGRHKILPGETLSEIALLYNVSVSDLERANNLLSRNKIRAGNWLHVPVISSKPSGLQNTLSPASLLAVAAEQSESKKKKTFVTENRRSARSPTAVP